MKTREIFESVRRQKGKGPGLQLRLTLLVCTELVFCILVAVGAFVLLYRFVPSSSLVVMFIELLTLSLLIAALVTNLLSKMFFEPIKKLGKAMEQVADGDFSVRLEEKVSAQEIMEIYTGFNLMAHELSAMEILQTDFVSNVSHEFKTPITAIEGYSMLLQGQEDLSPEQQEYVEKIMFNTRRLSSLVGSILLLSKLENQQIPTGQSRYRLDEQIRQSIVALEPQWEEKDVEFDVELASVEYVGNGPMMRHVWDNLIGNAIKFGPRGGRVRLLLQEGKGEILFTVEDEGPGISDEALKHIFNKFYQGDTSHKQEGNGLGLALAKCIVTIEGGTIQAENLPEKGCRFTVALPKER